MGATGWLGCRSCQCHTELQFARIAVALKPYIQGDKDMTFAERNA